MKNLKSKFLLLHCFVLLFISNSGAQVNASFTENGASVYLKEICYPAFNRQRPLCSFLLFSNITSDDTKGGGGALDNLDVFKVFDGFTMQADNRSIQELWSKYYQGIKYSNIFLDYTTSGTNSTIDQYRAEAQFMRAFLYFDLVRLFGGVPIYLTADVPLKPMLTRSSVSEVYAQIESDLLAAISNLPLKSVLASDEKYRISKGGAQSLLGKVYLYEGKWQQAADILTEVINSNQYSLLANYSDIWATSNEFNAESVLEFAYSAAEANWTNDRGNYTAMCMAPRTIQDGKSIYKRGWGLSAVTQDLVDAFIAEGDTIRLKATVIDEAELIKLGYTIDKSDINIEYTGYYDKKHTAYAADFSTGTFFSDKNEIVIRYADVLLMCAEALNKLGKDSEALLYLNAIRARANLSNINSSGVTLQNDIYKERRLELALEANRFYDLVRWGLAGTVLQSLGYASNNNVWPIPVNELAKNPNLTQNSGYNDISISSDFTPGFKPIKYYLYYKNNIDSIVRYQYNFANTDSFGIYSISYNKRTATVVDAKCRYFNIYTGQNAVSSRAVDTFNLNGKILSETQFAYNYSKSSAGSPYWDTIAYHVLTYNPGGINNSYTYYIWDKNTKNWVLNLKLSFLKDNYDNDTLVVSWAYNTSEGKYYAFEKTRYIRTYGGNGKLSGTTSYTATSADTTNFLSGPKFIYTYDSNGNQIQSDQYNWNGSSYDLVYSYKDILGYNSNNYVISDIQQTWNSTTSLFDNTLKKGYLLNSSNDNKVVSDYSWHIGFENWWLDENNYRDVYFYNNLSSVKEILKTDNTLKANVWPNPVTENIVNIDYELDYAGDVAIRIYSMHGKMVFNTLMQKQSVGKKQISVNTSFLPKGFYTITIVTGNTKYLKKLIIANRLNPN